MSIARHDPRPVGRAQIQLGALGVGTVFLLLGVLGFVPGITQPYAELGLATTSSQAKLLALFQVSVLHNLIHLGLGAAGLVLSRSPLRARNYLLGGGIVSTVLFLYGVVARRTVANVIPVNAPDDFLHLVLGLSMIAMAALLDRGPGWRRTLLETDAEV